jgi:hypothetical protein
VTRYLRITPTQPPSDGGVDPQGRIKYVFNVSALRCSISLPFGLEIAALLQAAGVGALNVSIFLTSQATLPSEGTVIGIRVPGGMAAVNVHNRNSPSYERPTAQITVHAATAVEAEAKARAAYNVLAKVVNQTV